jgi:alpha-D-xyloside xylohydrolase
MEDMPSRNVYLPPGLWIDYQSAKTYEGAKWHRIPAGEIPGVMLVKDGVAIPHVGPVQSTDEMDWQEIELVVFSVDVPSAEGSVCLPKEGTLHRIRLERDENRYTVANDPLQGSV